MGISRRNFLATAVWGTLLVSGGSSVAALLRFLSPNVVTPAPGPVEIGAADSFAAGSLTYVESARSYVGRDDRGFYAISAVCTHLGCTPRLDDDAFICPCHGSRFTRSDRVVNGPATRPLDRAFVGRAANGHLFVDRGRIVDENYRLQV